MTFIKATQLQEPPNEENAFWFVYSDTDILVEQVSDDEMRIPLLDHDRSAYMKGESSIFMGCINNIPCYASNHYEPDSLKDFSLVNIRSAHNKIDVDLWNAAFYGRHLVEWFSCSKFCGKCGGKTDYITSENAKKCSACGFMIFPRISPAIIVAVTRGDEILLARGSRFPNRKMFSVLAGFIDPGETIEECVRREVFEEVGVRIKNISYFGSQPWPFPDSLMIGCIAEYESGEIKIDDNEILEAAWFSKNNLPLIPQKLSIARKLIDHVFQL